MPLFSVVVPLFNRRTYIRRSIESVLRQTFQDFEINIVDDGSTDGSSDVVKAFGDPRVRLFTQANRGVGAARNRGIAEATGELIAFLDADDEWHPSFLEAAKELHKFHPHAGILATGYRRCVGANQRFDQEFTLVHTPGNPRCVISNYVRIASLGPFVTSSSAVVPRRVIEDVGVFLEGEPFGEDGEFWMRIGLRYPLAHDSRILAIYHSEAEGRASDHRRRPLFPPAVHMLQAALERGSLPDGMVQDVRRHIDQLKMQYFYWHFRHANMQEAVRLVSEKYDTAGCRIEAAILRWGLKFLSPRLICALKQKPLNVWSWLRQLTFGRRIFGSGELKLGSIVSVRLVRQFRN